MKISRKFSTFSLIFDSFSENNFSDKKNFINDLLENLKNVMKFSAF